MSPNLHHYFNLHVYLSSCPEFVAIQRLALRVRLIWETLTLTAYLSHNKKHWISDLFKKVRGNLITSPECQKMVITYGSTLFKFPSTPMCFILFIKWWMKIITLQRMTSNSLSWSIKPSLGQMQGRFTLTFGKASDKDHFRLFIK